MKNITIIAFIISIFVSGCGNKKDPIYVAKVNIK